MAKSNRPPMTEDDVREHFEVWAEERGLCLDESFDQSGSIDGTYADDITQWCYLAWVYAHAEYHKDEDSSD